MTAEIPLGTFHLRHRRLRRRQVHADCRDALQGAGPAADGRARAPRAARPDRGRRISSTKIIDIDQSPIGRTPPLEPGHLYRRVHAESGTGSPSCRRRRPAATAPRSVQLQRQGRPLRGVPGRRRDQDRDALPAGRLSHLRRLPRQALQSRNARDHLSRQVDRRRPGHDGRGRRGVLQGGAGDSRQAGDPVAGGPRLYQESASRRRRSPAARRSGSSCPRNCRGGRPVARSTSSTNRRPGCTSTTSASFWRCCTRWSSRATRCW